MKKTKTKKKQSKGGTVMAILKAPGEGKPDVREVVRNQITMKQSRGSSPKARRFLAAVRKLAQEHDYSLSVVDKDDGLEIQLLAVYTGKINVMLPVMDELEV